MDDKRKVAIYDGFFRNFLNYIKFYHLRISYYFIEYKYCFRNTFKLNSIFYIRFNIIQLVYSIA